jgi:hypothetical protein
MGSWPPPRAPSQRPARDSCIRARRLAGVCSVLGESCVPCCCAQKSWLPLIIPPSHPARRCRCALAAPPAATRTSCQRCGAAAAALRRHRCPVVCLTADAPLQLGRAMPDRMLLLHVCFHWCFLLFYCCAGGEPGEPSGDARLHGGQDGGQLRGSCVAAAGSSPAVAGTLNFNAAALPHRPLFHRICCVPCTPPLLRGAAPHPYPHVLHPTLAARCCPPPLPSRPNPPSSPTPHTQVVALAGRCAERLVLGEAEMSTAGGHHLQVTAAQRQAAAAAAPAAPQAAAAAAAADAARTALLLSCPSLTSPRCPCFLPFAPLRPPTLLPAK